LFIADKLEHYKNKNALWVFSNALCIVQQKAAHYRFQGGKLGKTIGPKAANTTSSGSGNHGRQCQ
jgi:hypothetical protein